MPAPTIYEGGIGQHRGTLFNKLNFWLTLRLPSRDQYLAKIKDNGGTIVKMEGQADVLVADHLRKTDAPDGSVSYKYIDACLANGALVDMAEHRIQHTSAAARSRPAKGTRNPFTELDKQILVTWVRRCESAGMSIQGNAIYQTLAENYPSHTWQSWRTKWLELSKLPEACLPAELPDMPPPTTREVTAPPSGTAGAAAPRDAPPPNQPPASRPSGQGRVFFTPEDDRILRDHVEGQRNQGGFKLYETLHEMYPHHTMYSWRSRWVDHLRYGAALPKAEAAPARQSPVNAPHASATPTTTPAAPPLARVETAPRPRASARPAAAPPPSLPAPPIASPNTTNRPIGQGITRLQELADRKKKLDLEEGKRKLELDERMKKIKLARSLQAVSRGYLVRRRVQSDRIRESITRFQARAQGFMTRSALGLPIGDAPRETEETQWFSARERGQTQADPLLREDEETEGSDKEGGPLEAVKPSDGEPRDALPQEREDTKLEQAAAQPPAAQRPAPALQREEFWLHFGEFSEVNDLPNLPWVQIGHRTVNFWNLWRYATREPHHPSRDWEMVAEGLGIDWVEEPDVPGQLKAAFEKHLLEFETFLLEFENSMGVDEGSDEEEEVEGEEAGEEEEGKEEGEEEGEEEDEEEVDLDQGSAEADEEEEEQATEVGESSRGAYIGELAVASEDEVTVSDTKFASSPPVIGFKRARRSSPPSLLGSVRKRLRLDPSSEVPYTPDAPRFREPPTEPDTASLQDAQQDGAHDMEQFTPSQQLLLELEKVSPAQEPSQTLPRRPPSSADRPLPSVERDGEAPDSDADSDSDSSSAFEPVSNLPRPAPPPPRPRTLPWAATNPPATTTIPNPPPPPQRPPRRPPPLSTPLPSRASAPTAPAPAPRAPAAPATQLPLDKLIPHLLSNNPYLPPALISHAVHATMNQPLATTEAVLASLARGAGIPRDMRGVWTEEDDDALRGIAGWVEGLDGVVPRKRGRGREEGVFWGLVGKHGRRGVVGREGFLREYDRA